MLQLVDGHHERGNLYYDETADISVFEDTQDSPGVSQFYAWLGDAQDHDYAQCTDTYATADDAVAALEQGEFLNA